MRRMAVTFISSMQSLLWGAPDEQVRAAAHTESIRQHMLDSLGHDGCAAFAHIERRILFAPDLQSLWYLRSDLMVALSSLNGEFIARQCLKDITDMFEGLLPRGMYSRPAPRRH